MLSTDGQLQFATERFATESMGDVCDTLRIPLGDFITASLISLALWTVIGWTAWAVVG
jgi:hypothetical protein